MSGYKKLSLQIDELAELHVQLRNHTEPHTDLLSLNRQIEQKMNNLQHLVKSLVVAHDLAAKLDWDELKETCKVADATRDEIQNFVLHSYGRFRPEAPVKLKDELEFCYRVLRDALTPSNPQRFFPRYLIDWLHGFNESHNYYAPQTVDEKSAFSHLIKTFAFRTKQRRRLLRFYSTDDLLCDPISVTDNAGKVLVLYQTPLTIFVRPKEEDVFKNSFSPEISLLKQYSGHVDPLFAPLLEAPDVDGCGNKFFGMSNLEQSRRRFRCVAKDKEGNATSTGHYDGERWVIVDRD